MLKSIGDQTLTLRFKDNALEEQYQEFKYKELSSKFTITCLTVINVVSLILLVSNIFFLSTDDTKFRHNLVDLIVFMASVVAEALLLMVPLLRFLRGIMYINAVSNVIFWLTLYQAQGIQ